MDDKLFDKISKGMMLLGLSYCVSALSKLPKTALKEIEHLIDDKDTEGVKRLVEHEKYYDDTEHKRMHDDYKHDNNINKHYSETIEELEKKLAEYKKAEQDMK